MMRRQVLVGASATAGTAAAARFTLNAGELGALGDGIADDAPAIQAALDLLGQQGGGTLFLPAPKMHYRIRTGLKIPSYVTLEGQASVRYPFNAGNRGVCALVADFADTRQWIIEADTRVNGERLAFDGLVASALPDGATYNCGIRNLLLTSKGPLPFGGIRLHGCPGALVEGVAVHRVGCGLLVNYSFGGNFSLQVRSRYYGVAVWDDANANNFELYCALDSDAPQAVPAAYRLPLTSRLSAGSGENFKLSGEMLPDSGIGLLCGSDRSASNGNVFDVVVEQFRCGILLHNSYATDLRKCYLEAGADRMVCGVAASNARFSIQSLHAYLSGTGAIFHFGTQVTAKIFGSGILHAGCFGKAPKDDGSSLLVIEGIDPEMNGAPCLPGVKYVTGETRWMPLPLMSGWRGQVGPNAPAVRLDPWSHRVEFKGAITGGRNGQCFIVPERCRPSLRRRFGVLGGKVEIETDGTALVTADNSVVSLDNIAYARW